MIKFDKVFNYNLIKTWRFEHFVKSTFSAFFINAIYNASLYRLHTTRKKKLTKLFAIVMSSYLTLGLSINYSDVWHKKLSDQNETFSNNSSNVYLYANLSRNAIVRLPNPWSGDSQGQEETFFAPSAGKQTCTYDTECSNHYPFQLP